MASSTSCSAASPTYGDLTVTATTTGIYTVTVTPSPYNSLVSDVNYYSLYSYVYYDDYPDSADDALMAPTGISISTAPSITGRIHSSTDYDYWFFNLYDTMDVQFSLSSAYPALAFILDSNGYVVGSASNNGSAVTIDSSLLSVGRYDVVVFGNPSQNYTLKIAVDDGGAGGTIVSEATLLMTNGVAEFEGPLESMATVRGSFDSETSLNYYEFEATKGAVFQIYTHDLGSGVDTVVEVYAPTNGFQNYGGVYPRNPADNVWANRDQLPLLRDDDGGVFANHDSRISFVAPLSGKYLVVVRGPGNTYEPGKASTQAGKYSLSIFERSSDYSVYFPQLPGEE